MNQQPFDIFMIGVGGQGIGLLSETLLRAADHAGFPARGVDTHGLAQRGGTVTSHLRLGESAFSPLVRAHQADLVIALERHEAVRGAHSHLRPGATLVYYDAEWQPLPVRLKKAERMTSARLEAALAPLHPHVIRVFHPDLPDPRMQNVAVLAAIIRERLIPGLDAGHLEAALDDLLEGGKKAANIDLFRRLLTPAGA